MSYLYLHIPFCSSICYYCDFKRSIYDETLVNKYLEVVAKEFKELTIDELETIYIGGGTPSCLSYKQLEVLLHYFDPYLKNVQEYTIESNLESLTKEKMQLLLKHGVNRISLGVQSMQDNLLRLMNRKHTSDDVIKMLDNLHEWGMNNISVDLIYGLPSQTLSMWQEDLHLLCSNPNVKHISLYSLTIEENSVFHKMNYKVCANDLEAKMYEEAIAISAQYGFHQYEIANFAKDGYESKHNKAYWRYEDFYGFGLGASGKKGNIRYTKQGSIIDYCNHKEELEEEVLSKEDMMFEHIMMSLRMRQGLDLKRFKDLYQVDCITYYYDKIKKRLDQKDLIVQDDYLFVSEKAMFYLHDILVDFMD